MNNPAGRLRYWLQNANEIPGETVALSGWAEVFDLDEATAQGKVEVIGRGAALMDLASETRQQMARLPGHFHADALLADFGEVEAALSQFLDLPRIKMVHFFQPLNGTGWRSLEFADLHLSSQLGERWIAGAQRDDLLRRVRSLINVVLESDDLGDEARLFVVDRLRQVETTLVQAQLRGVGDIESASDALVAGILRRADLGIEFFHTETGKLIGGFVFLVATALGMGSDYLAITDRSGTPVIENTVDVNVHVDDNNASDATRGRGSTGIVDAEVVEGDDGKDRS
jgi:hypothetical protein